MARSRQIDPTSVTTTPPRTSRRAHPPRPRHRTPIDYLDAGLGRLSDVAVSRKLGITHQVVGGLRRRLGIPSAGTASPSLLASVRRSLLARQRDVGACTRAAVQMARQGSSFLQIRSHFLISPKLLRRWFALAGTSFPAITAESRAAPWRNLDWNLPNKVIASSLGLHHSTVQKWRLRFERARRIPVLRPKHSPDDYRRAGVGRRSDALVARRLGVSSHAVAHWRRSHGIPAFPLVPPRDEVACAREAVSLYRQGVSARALQRRFHTDRVMLWLKEAGIVPHLERWKHTRARWEALDWSLTDSALATQLGLPPSQVWTWRRRLHMPLVPDPRYKRISDAAYRRAGAGRILDRIVASRLGISPSSVGAWRRKRGLPPARPSSSLQHEALLLWRQGADVPTIMRRLKVVERTVRLWLRQPPSSRNSHS